jgi:hypothetical protein
MPEARQVGVDQDESHEKDEAQHVVDAPSQPMTLGSKALGFTLIAFGLLLMALVLIGIFRSVAGG